MKQWVAFKLDDGSSIVVETDEPETGLTTRGFGRTGGITEASDSFTQALSKIRPATEQVITTLRELAK